MYTNADIFKIETNHIVPTRGKVLISEPFSMRLYVRAVCCFTGRPYARRNHGTCNEQAVPPLFLNDLLSEINCREDIPIYKGGPMSTDTLFYLTHWKI